MTEKHHPFYGYEIIRRKEAEYIEKLLKKYEHEKVDEELKSKIWDELQMEKHLGNVRIPFKLAIRHDATGKFPDYIEVILETKV